MADFSDDDMKRIIRQTLRGEHTPKNSPQQKNAKAAPVSGERWVKIKSRSGNKYGWVAVRHKEDGTWEEKEEWGKAEATDDNFAYELQYRSSHVLLDEIVRLLPSLTQKHYLFEYHPSAKMAGIPNIALAPLTSKASSATGTVYREIRDDGVYIGGNSRTVYWYGIWQAVTAGMGVVTWCGGKWVASSQDCYTGQ